MILQHGMTDVIEVLVESKAEINRADNKKQRTPLFVASSRGCVPVVVQLLAKKVRFTRVCEYTGNGFLVCILTSASFVCGFV